MKFESRGTLGLALLAAAAWPASAAAAAPLAVLSPDTTQRVEASCARLQEVLIGRRFVAETLELARRESDRAAGESGVRYVRAPQPVLVFGTRRLRALSDGELDLALVRELARAGAALPLALPEGDMAAYQAELEYAVDRAAVDEAFARTLRQSFRSVARQEEAARSEHERLQAKLSGGERLAEPFLPAPRGEFERIAYYILLFGRDRDEFYWAVERGLPRAAGTVRLTELEDFMERYGPDFSSARAAAGGRYVRLDGRRYAPALLQAARQLSETGGLARIREALGPFETVGADALQVKVNAWLRAAP